MEKIKRITFFASILAAVISASKWLLMLQRAHPCARAMIVVVTVIKALCARKLKQAFYDIVISIKEILQFLYLAFAKRRDAEK